MAFEWPIYKNDKERIKAFTKLYSHLSTVEAFNKHYSTSFTNEGPSIPKDYVVGDLVQLTITRIDRGDAVVDTNGFKTPVRVKGSFSKSRLTLPYKTEGKVLQIRPNELVVDVMGYQTQEHMANLLRDLERQTSLEEDVYYNVKNLRLTRGGFFGDLVIPSLEELIEGYTVPAFIPGSQIVLNKTDNFQQHVGQTVRAHISSVSPHGNVVCSVKEYLQHQGNKNLIQLFGMWCDNDQAWETFSNTPRTGRVTGTINNSSKKGVYVELTDLNVTAMIPHETPEIYNTGMSVQVYFKDFLEQTHYNKDMEQRQRVEPFEIVDGILKNVTIKPVLSF